MKVDQKYKVVRGNNLELEYKLKITFINFWSLHIRVPQGIFCTRIKTITYFGLMITCDFFRLKIASFCCRSLPRRSGKAKSNKIRDFLLRKFIRHITETFFLPRTVQLLSLLRKNPLILFFLLPFISVFSLSQLHSSIQNLKFF
jgi:hypothetical protein